MFRNCGKCELFKGRCALRTIPLFVVVSHGFGLRVIEGCVFEAVLDLRYERIY
jgi:hypothetical protein